MREPTFWWRDASIIARLLAPAGTLYGAMAQLRLHERGQRAPAPVICIGNLTLGGAGKTPLALATAGLLKKAGEQPVFLTRGYGGALAGPIDVDPMSHTAMDVGDEALLLAQMAPTILAHARAAGAAMAVHASVIVMDDGFQNRNCAKIFRCLPWMSGEVSGTEECFRQVRCVRPSQPRSLERTQSFSSEHPRAVPT